MPAILDVFLTIGVQQVCDVSLRSDASPDSSVYVSDGQLATCAQVISVCSMQNVMAFKPVHEACSCCSRTECGAVYDVK